MKPLLYLFWYVIAIFNSANAASSLVEWEKLEGSGLACPGSQFKKVIDATNPNKIKLEFGQFALKPGQVRKACQIVMPVKVPSDKKLSIKEFKISGSVDSSKEGVQIKIESFLVGSPQKSQLDDKVKESGKFEKLLPATALSKCGVNDNFRISASILAQDRKTSANIESFTIELEQLNCP